jgi:hypothetical protein
MNKRYKRIIALGVVLGAIGLATAYNKQIPSVDDEEFVMVDDFELNPRPGRGVPLTTRYLNSLMK